MILGIQEMKIDQSKFLIDIEVVDEKIKALYKMSLRLIELFQKKEIDLVISEVTKRQGIITGFLDACKMIGSKISKLDDQYVDQPLTYLKNNCNGELQEKVARLLDEWESILILEEKIQTYAKQLPKIMKENLVQLQRAKPAMKAYGSIADMNSKTDPRFERKK